MAGKKKVSGEGSPETQGEAKEVAIQPLSIDFNKEDLNTLVKKVNEIITYLNR